MPRSPKSTALSANNVEIDLTEVNCFNVETKKSFPNTKNMAPSVDKLAEYKEAFALFDKKGEGSIEHDSVGNLLRAVGQNPTQAEVNSVLKTAPTSITFDYFVDNIIEKNDFNPRTTVEEFVQGFQVFDKDGNGFISSGELRYVLTSLGEKLTDAEVDDLLKIAQVDKNGFVNYEQFVRTILNQH